ncbi:hypothetical protein Taro_019354 [Colocasia esculenta]|uniref:Uncharacterized protein n=1 Tax=Colocasia esculenta TaxID=4460 RepID=A0A843UW26_COLES|nr:hypothetical protein [Colocasia esculenta]
MASGDKMSFWGRKTFVSHSEIAILAGDLPDSKDSDICSPAIGTARKAPIQNRHLDPVGTSSASLDYANRWRAQHTEWAYHGDRKSSSTRLEISTRGRRYGCTNIAGIVTPTVYSHPFSERTGHNFPPRH